jgi:hypothetical protein
VVALAPRPIVIYRTYFSILTLQHSYTSNEVQDSAYSGTIDSHLVPYNSDPGDEILNKLCRHTHMGYAWLFLLLLGIFRK